MRRVVSAWERFASAWDRFWFQPVEASTFAVFRIAFALVVVGWTVSLAPTLYAFYSTDGILPSQPEYEGTAAWGLLGVFESDIAVTVMYFLLLLGGIALLFGFQTRIAAVVVFICLVSFGRRNPWVLNSGDQLLQALAFYVVLMPAGAALSVDRLLKRGEPFWDFPTRAIWPLRLVQIQVSIIYLAAVWAKVRGTTWNDGTAVSYAMRIEDVGRLPVPGFITDSIVISNVFTYGTLATELALGILVWNRVLRPWVLLLGVGLHLGIDYSVRVGFFSYAILITYIAFLPPGTATSLILSFRDRISDWSLPRPIRRATRKL
jgi:vitamin K-dependent gamma-carboxylase-like protein